MAADKKWVECAGIMDMQLPGQNSGSTPSNLTSCIFLLWYPIKFDKSQLCHCELASQTIEMHIKRILNFHCSTEMLLCNLVLSNTFLFM